MGNTANVAKIVSAVLPASLPREVEFAQAETLLAFVERAVAVARAVLVERAWRKKKAML